MEFTKKDIITGNAQKQTSVVEEQTKKMDKDFVEMISELNTSSIQVHIFHWQVTKTGSHAAHSAYGEYYEAIPGLIDDLVESYQGKYGLIDDFTCNGVVNKKTIKETISYFEDLESMIEKKRKSIKDSYLQNQIDNIIQLINSTNYKLKYLS
jgi:DNA-binding ferritin-like protein